MYDIIIVGGGMAAYSAALFAGRRGLKVLVLAKDIGGQANSTDVIENYPGISTTGGYELVASIRKQAEGWGVQTEIAEVQKLKPVPDGDFVIQAFDKQYKSKAVILAFGKTPMDLSVPGESELKGKGVSYCATCDAPLYKGRTVIVAGYGDFGLEAALLCAKYAKKVYTLSKTDKLIGHPALAKKVLKHKKIELVPNVQIQEICGEGYLDHIKCHDLKTGQQIKMQAQGLFVEIGYIVNSGWLQNVVELDEHGQIVIGPDQSTSLDGVFAAGDATNRPYKQAVISAGEGASAALAAHDWFMRQRGSTGLSSDWTEIRKVK
jgi:thioredoxin reductase (NADPH)